MDDDDDYAPPSDMEQLRTEVKAVSTTMTQIAASVMPILIVIAVLLALILWRVW